ncbi:hypothetical protein B0T25DRAFT_435281, partial [Lasiosphaeria hispida]
VAERMDAPFYHAGDPNKEVLLARWKKDNGVMIATTALGLGVDFAGVVLVLCLGVYSAIDMVQMFGCVGRDSSPAPTVLVVTRDDLPTELGERFATGCRQRCLSSYLNGGAGAVCDFGHNACDHCAGGATRAPGS